MVHATLILPRSTVVLTFSYWSSRWEKKRNLRRYWTIPCIQTRTYHRTNFAEQSELYCCWQSTFDSTYDEFIYTRDTIIRDGKKKIGWELWRGTHKNYDVKRRVYTVTITWHTSNYDVKGETPQHRSFYPLSTVSMTIPHCHDCFRRTTCLIYVSSVCD